MDKLTIAAFALLALAGSASLQAETTPSTEPTNQDVAPKGGRGVTPDSGDVSTVPRGGRGETGNASTEPAMDGGTAGGATKMDPKKAKKMPPTEETPPAAHY